MIDSKSTVVKYSLEGKTLSVIVPAYNEGKRLRDNMGVIVSTMETLGIAYEIILVNDGSKDNTEAEAFAAAKLYPKVQVVSYSPNRGKGNALKEGWKHTKGELVTFLDADLELHPKQLARYLEEMRTSGADIIIGSKRHKESIVNYPWKRRFFSKGYNMLVRAMFQITITDTQPGLKLFKREVLEKEFHKVMVKRWAFDLELLVNAIKDGFTIAEVPITINWMRDDGGRISLKDVVHIFRDTMGIFYRVKLTGFYERSLNNGSGKK